MLEQTNSTDVPRRNPIREIVYTLETGEQLHLLQIEHTQKIPTLPQGYAYMGGVARNIFLQEMGQRYIQPQRDVDIVAIQEWHPDKGLTHELSMQYMPNDYAHGYGVKEESLASYFRSRDFTINEVLVHGSTIYATKEAARDLLDCCIRPTQHETDKWFSYEFEKEGVHPKLVMKALRLLSEFRQYGDAQLQNIEDWQFKIEGIPIFYIALALDKCMEIGDSASEAFYIELLRRGVVGPNGRDNQLKAANATELTVSITMRMQQDGYEPFEFTNGVLDIPWDSAAMIANDYVHTHKDKAKKMELDYI